MSKKKKITLIVSIILTILAMISGVSSAVVLGKNNQHVYEEIVDVKYLKTAATCESGAIYYKACSCGEVSEETFEHGQPLGHDYGELIAESPATCTGTGVKAHYHCSRCAHNFDVEKAEIVELTIPAKGHSFGGWINGKPATETDDGEQGHYHCPDCNKNFDSDKKTEIPDVVIPPVVHKHTFGVVSYVWDATHTSCTATRVCADDATHTETATSTNVTSSVTQKLTCTANEETTYTATFAEDWCTTQTETVTTATAQGHTLGAVSYVWDATHASCTATRVCGNSGCGYSESATSISVNSSVTQNLTCTVDEETTYTATFAEDWCTTQTDTITTATAQGHTWGAVSYAWDSAHSKCTATRVCGNSGCGYSESATSTGVNSAITQNQTCLLAEITTHTATFAEKWCTPQTDTEQTKAALNHANHGTWIDEVSATEFATGTYGHYYCPDCNKNLDIDLKEIKVLTIPKLNHVHVYTNVVSSDYLVSAATCTASAVYYKSCSCGAKSADTFTDGTPLGHKYGTVNYAWDGTYSECTATRSCDRSGCNHSEEAKVAASVSVTQKLTCTANEITTYTATFAESWCAKQIETVTTAYAQGHKFGKVNYVWDANHKSCTATRVCTEDSNHVETVTSTGVNSSVTQNLTCTADEKTTYTATFGKSWCDTQTETVTTATAQGHKYQNIVNAKYSVSAATCTASAVYYKSCSCGAQSTDTFTDGTPLGHKYANVSYAWGSAHSQCTATGTCSVCSAPGSATSTSVTSSVTQKLTCTVDEETTYTATFGVDWCTTQTDTVTTATAHGHSYGNVSYAWDTNHTTCTATSTCGACSATASATATGAAITSKTTPATCTAAGQTVYTATFAEDWCLQQTDTVTSAKLGHDFGAPQYVWSSDNLTCTATRTCGRSDCGHSEEEKATTVKTDTQAVGCEQAELSAFTASFTNKWCEEQTKTGVETAPATGHTYGDWVEEVAATCTSTGELAHYHCSGCGKNFDADYAEFNATIEALGHKWLGSACSRCSKSRASQGLKISGNRILGIGTCTDKKIYIPSIYSNYTVDTIYQYAFESRNLDYVFVPATVTTLEAMAFRSAVIKEILLPTSLIYKKCNSAAFEYAYVTTVYYRGAANTSTLDLIFGRADKKPTIYFYRENNPFEGDGAVTSGNYWHYGDNGDPEKWTID